MADLSDFTLQLHSDFQELKEISSYIDDSLAKDIILTLL